MQVACIWQLVPNRRSIKVAQFYNHLGTLGGRSSHMRTINSKNPRTPLYTLHRKSRSTGGQRRNQIRARMKSYMNVTGPGDYNLPRLWGTLNTSSSKMRSGPFFSIAARCKTPIISKEHTQDMKGKGNLN